MNVVIPETLRKQVRTRARKRGLTETEYIHTVIKQAIAAEDSLVQEMELWDRSSLGDFDRFAKKYRI